MKFLRSLIAMVLALAFVHAKAQNEPPKGFKNGAIVLADGSSMSGFVKDNMHNNASVTFLAQTDGKKKIYDGGQINSIEIEGVKFVCINRDFFKVLSEGDLNFLQKSSDASGKVYYNGNEAMVCTGTAGKPGDYFIYRTRNKELKLITKKNYDEVVTSSFENYTAAIEKAQTVNGDLSRLKEAVEIYNKRTTN
jgi:hypothetical protein